jgi:hypothetical protein
MNLDALNEMATIDVSFFPERVTISLVEPVS